MSDKPQIWTKHGLMFEDQLEYDTSWENTDEYVSFTETYKNKLDGEVVKQSKHVLCKKPLEMGIEQQTF